MPFFLLLDGLGTFPNWQTDQKWHEQGERKKQFTAAIPDTLLAQVRELAAIQHQEAPGTGAAGMTSRSGRTVHRK
jgi:hypothetical protein